MTETTSPFLYRQVIDRVRASIRAGNLRPGDRLPSLRKMSQTAGVSVPTVRQAYIELERQRQVESRPRSGFYVRNLDAAPLVRPSSTSSRSPVAFRSRPLMERVFDGIDQPDLVPLGIANPTMAKPAAKALNRTMKRIMARTEERVLNYSATLGEPGLRRQIALRILDTTGTHVEPENICVTNGCQEALLLALQAVASPGDVVAVETPTYHGMLELIDSLGMLAVEVETCPEEGIEVEALEETLSKHDVKVCMLSTTLSNPLGVTMPDERRAALVELLAATDTAMIEDDVYGELRFDGERPVPAQFLEAARNKRAKIITCSSFSKTAAPGYRVGWIVTGPYRSKIASLKRSLTCSSGLLPQLTLADFLASGDYDRHLRGLLPVLRHNAERMQAAVSETFPEGTRTSRPQGGAMLWVQLPKGTKDVDLFEKALDAGISIAPGRIFSPSGRYSNCVRLGYGHPWDERTEQAIAWLASQCGRG